MTTFQVFKQLDVRFQLYVASDPITHILTMTFQGLLLCKIQFACITLIYLIMIVFGTHQP